MLWNTHSKIEYSWPNNILVATDLILIKAFPVCFANAGSAVNQILYLIYCKAVFFLLCWLSFILWVRLVDGNKDTGLWDFWMRCWIWCCCWELRCQATSSGPCFTRLKLSFLFSEMLDIFYHIANCQWCLYTKNSSESHLNLLMYYSVTFFKKILCCESLLKGQWRVLGNVLLDFWDYILSSQMDEDMSHCILKDKMQEIWV